MRNIDSKTHTRGESVYLDDIPVIAGTLFGVVYGSPVANGKIIKLHLTAAQSSEGVVRIFTFLDVPGKNQIGGIVPDEPLLAEWHVYYRGMPVAFIVAESTGAAEAALKKIKIDIEPLPVITDPRVAKAEGKLIVPPRTFALGNTAETWHRCEHVFEGIAETNGQEHLYIETQGAYSIPTENESIKIYSSTQGPTAVQRHMAHVLGIPMHRIEVDVTRLGGGFGGKEDQATHWAILCSLATYHLKRPVKFSMHRNADMYMTGKRHPYSTDFKIGLDSNLKILAYEVTFYQNAGAAADLSPAVLERTLFHCTNAYFIPNVKATAYSCRTNLPPNTAFRGFGGPQGMFVIESAIARAADELGISASVIQKKNLLVTGDEFPYGQKANSEAVACWEKAEALYDTHKLTKQIEVFNTGNKLLKKGLSFMPVCFGISFTKTFMNQARALVHVYTDGSVGISTGAVEMGQGVNTKMLQVAALTFAIPGSKIKIQTTNTSRVANTSPSAASATADLNGQAVLMACLAIAERLKEVAATFLQTTTACIELRDECIWLNGSQTDITWEKLVMMAYVQRVSLSENAHYATPEISFDHAKEKGHPFSYHVYGVAITVVTIDCLRGIYTIDGVHLVHDIGSGMNPSIDKGQIEGGLVQGIGWMTMEELVYDKEGRLRSDSLSTYKVPDIYSVPKTIDIYFLENSKPNLAALRSKAVGEPPLMYGIGTFFALRNAVRAFNPLTTCSFGSPMTPEKVLLSLYENINEEISPATNISEIAIHSITNILLP